MRLLRRGGLLWWGVMLALATGGAGVAYAAFSTPAQNTGNRISSGTVVLSDNDSGQAMLSLSGAAAGASDTSCIRTRSDGTLPSGVDHYASVAGSLAPYLSLTITRGGGADTFDSCTGFTPDVTDYIGAGAGVIFDGKLADYPTTSAAAIVDPTDNGTRSYAATVATTSGLVNYWRLGDAASTTAGDSKGTNPGTYVNGPTLGVTGAPGGDSDTAVRFDGVDDHVTAARQIADDFSIEFWFKSTQGVGTGAQWWQGAGLVDADVAGTSNDFGVSLRADGRVVAGVGNPDTSVVSTAGGYDDGAWHHVAFTRRRTTGAINLYVDGASAGSATGSTLALSAPASIDLGRLASATNHFTGSLDEVAIYNVALTAATVAAHQGAVGTTPETWTAGETHDYRFQISLGSDPAAGGRSSTAEFTWEAGSR